MDYNSRKTGIVSASTDSPSKSGRLAATALGRGSKSEYHSHSGDPAKRSHDHRANPSSQTKPKTHIDRNSSTENSTRPPSEKVLHRLKDDRERAILHQSLKRAKSGEDSKLSRESHQSLKSTKVLESDSKPKLKHDRERDILNQSLKRTKVSGDREDLKLPVRSKDHENPSLKKPHVRDSDVTLPRPKGGEDLKVRHEKPRPESVKKTTATRPSGESKGHIVSQKVVKKESTPSTKELPQAKEKDQTSKPPSRKEEEVKKGSLAGEKKRPMGAPKLNDGKAEVRVRSVTKIEPVFAPSHSASKNGSTAPKGPVKSVKMVSGTVTKAKEEKMKKKVFSLPGQRFEPPEERDALRLFYGSLHTQIPTSDMANIWLMEHGLLEADEAQKVLTQKVKSKTGVVSKASPYQAPTPSRFTNGSAGKSSKFKNESFLDIKPVSKKLRL